MASQPHPEPAQNPKLHAGAEVRADEPPRRTLTPKLPVARRVWASEPVTGRGDAEVARIADAQRGVIDRDQLLEAGLGRHAIAHRLAHGRLYVVHPRIYLVGRPTLEPLAAETAAVLHFRGHGVLSHRSAAALWGLGPAPEDVTLTLVAHEGRRPGLRTHRTDHLDERDLRARQGLPVTAPGRTILDLAAEVGPDELERALAEARVQRLLRDGDLEAALARAPRRNGVARLRALLAAEAGPAATRMEMERRMLALIRAAQLPAPLVNSRVSGFEVDFHWPDRRLIVETDGHRFHGHRGAFERDRRRDQILIAAGYRVMRVTWRQLIEEPMAVVARIALALAAPAA